MPDDTPQTDKAEEVQPIVGVIADDKPVSSEENLKVESAISAIQVAQPSKPAIQSGPAEVAPTRSEAPWTLQQFFNGEIDLDVELSKRFQTVPLMTTVKFRDLGDTKDRGVATLSTPDGSAQVIFDADRSSRVVQMSFTWGSMLTLRFTMRDLSDMDRSRWLQLMRRTEGGLSFLWGPTRWEKDYMICISRKYFTNIYAFSPNGFEASVRLSPDVVKELLDWLDQYWKPGEESASDDSHLLTW